MTTDDAEKPEAQIGLEQSADGRRGLQDLHRDGAYQDADHAAEKSEQGGFPKNHSDDARTLPADGEQNADFVRALENGHEHRVHHSKDTDKHGQQRGAPAHGANHAISLAAAQVFANRHGPNFRNSLVDLLTERIHFFFAG